METIKVKDIVSDGLCTNIKDGIKLYDLIVNHITQEKQITISFEGIKRLITAFTNVSIGKLYKDFPSDKLEKFVKLVDYSDRQARYIQKSIDTAKRFYKNDDELQRYSENINRSLDIN
ncbi:MAG: STAS-like domain-containing protein [Prolixibacteraceae bacterium]|jgi:hypothetical protein|nr:STAS-like domain-containing protein [Prolixibacteraceae bacterium]